MKFLLLLVFAGVAGAAAGAMLFGPKPLPGDVAAALAARSGNLEREVEQLRRLRPSPPTHEHWRWLKRHLDVYETLEVDHLHPDRVGKPGFGGEQWGGVMSGPTLDLLLAARLAQTLVPVYFDRIAVKEGTAQMSFYVLGAKED